MSISRPRWLRFSLASKYRVLFGTAVILIIAAALCVPWMRMEALIDEQPFREAKRVADDFFRLHLANPPTSDAADFHAMELRGQPPGVSEPPRFVRRAPELDRPDGEAPSLMDPFAASAMRRFLRRPGTEFTYEITQTPQGRRFHYASAVFVTRSCLRCHGEGGTARPYRESELAGIITVDLPADASRFQLIYNRLWLIAAGVLAGVLAILVFYVITRRFILAPIDELRGVAARVAEGNLEVRSELKTGDEFEELSASVNHMLERLQASREELRKANRLLDEKLEQMAETNVALFEANRVKNEFLANVTHELRTPLTSIIGFAELLSESSGQEQGGKPSRYAENILISGRILLEIINDLLDLAKIEAGRVELHLESVRLSELVESLVEFMRPVADKKGQELLLTAEESLPILITDRGKLRQILFNLLSNALKFTPEDGRVTVRITREGADRVRIAITDTGPGIASEHQAMIFDKFRQIDGSATREHHGAGLGLAIAKELVTLLGGEIGVDSVLGMGATFWLKLPLVTSEAKERAPVSLV